MNENILTRALDILQAVARGGPRRFGELRETFGINQTTLTKILKILTACGYLEKGADGYVLGATFHALSGGQNHEQTLRDAAHGALHELSGQWGITTLLIVHEGRRAKFLDKVVQDHSIYGRPVNQWFPLYPALPWDLHRLRRTGVPDIDATFSEANAFWAVRKQPPYTRKVWRKIFEEADNEDGCMTLSPGFPCEARGAVPLRPRNTSTPEAYLGFIAIADHTDKQRKRLNTIMQGLREQAQVIETKLNQHLK